MYRRPKERGAGYPTTFTSAVSFKVLEQLENVIPVCKRVEAKLNFCTLLNDLERLGFVICFHTNDLLFHQPRHDKTIFCLVLTTFLPQSENIKTTKS